MRGLSRPEPPTLFSENAKRWAEQWMALRERNPSAQFPWYEIDGQAANHILLPVLMGMTQDHCSFCDFFPVQAASQDSIEHFRPKSAFPSLAYDWENLFYCCSKCQQAKLEQWEDLLLKPDSEAYREEGFEAHFEIDLGTGELVAITEAAETLIRLYGLNGFDRPRYRLVELRKWDRAGQPLAEIDDYAYRFLLLWGDGFDADSGG